MLLLCHCLANSPKREGIGTGKAVDEKFEPFETITKERQNTAKKHLIRSFATPSYLYSAAIGNITYLLDI